MSVYLFVGFRLNVRYQKVLMRARFDAYKEEKDPRKAQLMLADGCKELWQKKHFKPARCTFPTRSLILHISI